ncbi:MAG TPA: MDR family MFS transporter [Devosiaceae bacterium]|nr:MDR family MFS transporter [Devosiaceae bacterium]
MTSETLSTDLAAEAYSPSLAARNRLVINILLVSTFVVILNETVMSVAIPRLMESLSVPASAAQWLTTAFLLTMAVVIPVTGFLLQRLNTRPIYLTAMTLFCLGTLTAALAPGLEVLIIARVVQACGTAIMLPLLMTTVMTLVPPETRGRTMGNISIVISVAPAIGPTLSGLILNYLDWRWMFILVLPIALAAMALGARRMVNVTTPRYAPLDLPSVVVSALAFGGIVYGLSNLGVPEAGQSGWIALGVGVLAMAIFIARQLVLQRKNGALLDLRPFVSKNFSISILMMAVSMMALFGTIILLPIYLQNVLGLSTLQTGLLLLPGGLLMGLLAPPVGRLYDRFGPTVLLVPGTIIVSGVLWAMTLLGPTTWVGAILAGHIAMSIGLALLFTPLFTVSLSSVKPEFYSHGSALLGSIQQVAGAAGVALFVALMSSRSDALVAAGEAQKLALSGGITTGFFCGAVISVLAVIAAFFIRRAPEQQGPAPGH